MNELVIGIAILLAIAMFIWAMMNDIRDRPEAETETLAPECETDRRETTIKPNGQTAKF